MIFEYENIKVINNDCMRVMPDIEDNYFDIAIVDPPYGINKTWSKSRRDRFYHECDLHEYENDKIPSKEYFAQMQRISKNQIIWGGNYFTEFLKPTNSWIIWDKLRDVEKTFMSECEMAWTSYQKPARSIKLIWDGARKCEKGNKIHPHQKPVKLYYWLLQKYAERNYKIIDTHAGSFSSAIGAHMFGVSEYLGIEKDYGYFKKSYKRFEQYSSQKTLF